MIRTKKDDVHKYLIGTALTLSMLLGGGTDVGLWSDALLQILILVAVTPVLLGRDGAAVDRTALGLVALIMIAPLAQLVPFPAGLIEALRPAQFRQPEGSTAAWLSISTGLGSTLLGFAYVGVLGLLFLAILRMPGLQVHALLPFVLLGVACNAAFVFVQYSASDRPAIEGVLPFTIYAGLFANRNHLASLLYVALPFLVYFATFRGRAVWSFLAIAATVIVLLAAGSRAGAIIGLAAVVCATIVVRSQSKISLAATLTTMVIVGIYAMGTATLIDARDLDPEFGRLEFLRTTIAGIRDNWLLGVGYGTFPRAYQAYEDATMIFASFVNHAHNDYVELIFEGGVLAGALLLAYLILLVRQAAMIRFNQFQKAALLSITFLLIHSVVDYPLRTMALSVTFVWLNAVIFHTDLRRPKMAKKHRISVSHNGRTMALPIEG